MRSQIKSYRDLEVWQKAMDLVEDCYRASKAFPKNEAYGLAAQLQRAVVSIPANIAEGHSTRYRKEFLHYLSIALGSLAELETHIEIAGRLNYLSADETKRLIEQSTVVGRLLGGLRKSLLIQPPVPNPQAP